ncbi:hypothetical protein [Aliiroseovarius subalbicans]|uniref:hypothetical protein n=1 Tax=Aliiroseovarius subalbicans TaxID=2925840 RepID=UPI001F55AC73|nr:hypothetical protein [Aliiroseovarius subalbicans]MCI2398708.1 hypothetical protein [Aliiroseovarius subalbicans]
MDQTLSTTGLELHSNGTRPTRVQVFGERSSGTNFVKRLIGKNTVLRPCEDYGWKHGFPQMTGIGADTLIVACFRNVHDWLRSMHAKPWHCPPEMQALAFSDFIRAEWATVIDRPRYFPGADRLNMVGQPLQQDRDPATGLPFDNILQLRRAKAASLLTFRNRGCNLVLARLDAVQPDPAAFLAQLTRSFDLPAVDPVKPVVKRLGAKFKYAVDAHPETPNTLSNEDLAFIQSQLDPDLEATLGY